MQKPLQSVGDLVDLLLAPSTLLQLAGIAAAIVLGWWIARLVRPRLSVAMAPEDLRELQAAADNLVNASRLFRAAAERAGESQIAGVMEETERIRREASGRVEQLIDRLSRDAEQEARERAERRLVEEDERIRLEAERRAEAAKQAAEESVKAARERAREEAREIASETAPEWERFPEEPADPESPRTPPSRDLGSGSGGSEPPQPGPAGTEGEDTGSRRSRRSTGGPGSGGYRTFSANRFALRGPPARSTRKGRRVPFR